MTQVEKLYEMLTLGPVSGMDCIEEGIMNYKGRICDLRKLGVNIDTEWETRVNAKGEKKTYAIYRLA